MSSMHGKVPKMVYGDAARREAMALPATFGELQRRCHQAMGCYCEMYLDSGADGHIPASSPNVRITNEAQYGIVRDRDVIILVDPAGRRLSLKELGSIFDGLTVYRRDYVAHPYRAPRGPAGDLELEGEPLPDMSAWCYRTTYRSHFTPKALPPRDVLPSEVPDRAPDGCLTGKTTYECDYVAHPRNAKPHPGEDVREIPRPWTQEYRSTYAAHFLGPKVDAPKRGSWGCDFPDKPPGAPWRATEYADEYVEKVAVTVRPDPGIHGGPSGDHGMGEWESSHRAAYVDHGRTKRGDLVFVEPERGTC